VRFTTNICVDVPDGYSKYSRYSRRDNQCCRLNHNNMISSYYSFKTPCTQCVILSPPVLTTCLLMGPELEPLLLFFLLLANGMRDNLRIIDIIIDTNNSQPFGAEEERLLLLPNRSSCHCSTDAAISDVQVSSAMHQVLTKTYKEQNL
jgi:hypothetical protein